jgi:hypothetical protein
LPVNLSVNISRAHPVLFFTFDLSEFKLTREEIKENIRQVLKELQLVEQGKSKTRPAKEFLNEL